MKHLKYSLFILFCALFIVRPLFAAKPVTVGAVHNPPMVITNADGDPTGYFVDIITYIAEKADWELHYYVGNWDECVTSLTNGNIDLILNVDYSHDRDEVFDFNELNLLQNGEKVFLKSDSEVETIFDLNGKNIAGVKNDVYLNKFTNTLTQQEIEYDLTLTDSYLNVMDLVKNSEVDVGVVNIIYGKANNAEFRQFTDIYIPITENPVELRIAGADGRNSDLLRDVDKYFTYMKHADYDRYKKLNEKWTTPYIQQSAQNVVKWILLFIGGLIIFFTFNYFIMKSQVKKKTLEIVVKNEELIQEIHEHNIARENLQKKDELLQGVAKSLNILLTEREYSSAIKKALNNLGESAGVDRVYIFEFGKDELSGERIFTQRYGYSSAKGSREIAEPDIHAEPFDHLYPVWHQILSEGKIISGPLRKFDIPAKPQLEQLDIKSILVIPILIDGDLYGFIAFDDCKEERQWDESEKSILYAAATSIGGAIQREQIERKILEMNEELEQRVFERTAQLIAANDELEILNEVTQQVSINLDFDSVFDKIAEFLKSIYNFEGCAFAKVNEDKNVLIIEKTTADPEFVDSWGVFRGAKIPLNDEGGILAQCVLKQETKFYSYSADMDKSHAVESEFLKRYNAEAVLMVPIIVSHEVIGVFYLTTHKKNVAYTKEDQESVQRFASQLALVIKNSMLYDETEKTKNQLEDTLSELKKAQKQIIIQEKMASLGELTAGIAHEIKNPLNFVNNFAAISADMIEELKHELLTQIGKLGQDVMEDIIDLLNNIETNVQKINQHGKRADSIVQGMLLHSRGGKTKRQETDINRIIQEASSLAYHGLRAKDPSFTVEPILDLDDTLKPVHAITQDISRVFINMFTNACYAVNEKKKSGTIPNFKPQIKILTRDNEDKVEIRIWDNGTGIPDEIKDKIFTPFFTTKNTGEGTGLGLSISYDIIVQEHGGSIEIQTMPGEFTEFIIMIPKSVTDERSNQ